MAESLIESMSGDFKPEEFTDDYRTALQAVIDAKVSGKEIVAPVEAEEAPSGAVDLMAALRASVERARSAREGGGRPESEEREPVEPTPISAAKSAKRAGKKAAPAAKTEEPVRESKAAASKSSAQKRTGAKSAPAKKAEPAKKKAEPAKKATKRAAGSTAKSRRSA